MKTALDNTGYEPFKGYDQLEAVINRDTKAVWCDMNPAPRPCFNTTLLRELRSFQHEVEMSVRNGLEDIDFVVWRSGIPGVWNLGGDLNLFRQLIENRDRETLSRYAKACIDVVHPNYVSFGLPDLTTICVLEGNALGGGFEAAMSGNVLIAEEGVQMGLPEILFNLFPGMGAYSMLSRKIGPALAERIILSGDTYEAERLYELGVVDVLAKKGEGVRAAHDYIKKQQKSRNGTLAIRRAAQRVHPPIEYREMMDVVDIWVDAALQLTEKDLRVMNILVNRQEKLMARTSAAVQKAS
ncbi:MAG: enoyl-CoA hydratase [Sedimenticola sp.]|nr:MAG: enoyl-CoA hydratase [Sedimenticola sp.]